MPEEPAGGLDLGDAEEQYTLLMECVTDYAIFFMDVEGQVAAWNTGAERIFGFTEEEALGLPFARFFTPEDVERGIHQKELQSAVKHGRASDDKWHVRKDGTRLWVSGITTALRDEGGCLRGFAKVMRDRTEHKSMEEKLRQRAAELAEETRRTNEFLAMLAHELRNPLAPIRNASQILRLRGQADPSLDWAGDMIDRQVQHLTRLVDDLLDVARFRQGKVKLDKKEVELASAVAQAVEMCRPLIESRKHQLDVRLPSEPMRIDADPTRVAQAVGNLLTNAAKYTPEEGQIWLTAERTGGEVVLRVKDSGVGIGPELLPRVFDLFVQAEVPAGSQAGLGLGLSLVKNLVELHGGTVSAQSEGPGRGSEFVINLPLLMNGGKSKPEGSEITPCSTSTCRVLVVDDLRDAADSLAMLLCAWGHEVRVAHNGADALAVAREFRPEIVLLDLGLPGMTGYEVAVQLRKEPGLEKTRLIALTGFGQEDDHRRTTEAGFNGHLVKPADLDALQALLGIGNDKK